AAHAQWQISPTDGSSIKFGFLVQGQAESVDINQDDTAQNLFFRRLRVLAGGKINDQWSFFFETDSPNLGKGTTATSGTGTTNAKNEGDLYIQDFVVSYKPGSDAFNLDLGMMLGEVSYNSNQSAASLMAVDYGTYTFVWSSPLQNRVGRDYGVRARGYLFDDHLEYRASVLQGVRGENQTNDFRFLGRLMFNVFEAQKGNFYTGTTLGKKQLLSFGVSYDTQEDYETIGVDAFWDQPIGDGNGLTMQADWSSIDGDVFLTSLPEQDNLLVEAGFYINSLKLLPFIQYNDRNYDDDALADTDKVQVGLGYMFAGHNGNVKVSYGQYGVDGGDDRDEFWLQLQLFRF
ncbi:MAG TPA: porin, partial [Steroidobacteraceae bacterium]|nr:porin [Steroidobacteraceae bacterium]